MVAGVHAYPTRGERSPSESIAPRRGTRAVSIQWSGLVTFPVFVGRVHVDDPREISPKRPAAELQMADQ